MNHMGKYRHRETYLHALLFLVVLFVGCGPNEEEKRHDAGARIATARELFDAQQYNQALQLVKEATSLNTEISNDTGLVENDIFAAHCQRQLGEYDSALVGYQSAIERSHG